MLLLHLASNIHNYVYIALISARIIYLISTLCFYRFSLGREATPTRHQEVRRRQRRVRTTARRSRDLIECSPWRWAHAPSVRLSFQSTGTFRVWNRRRLTAVNRRPHLGNWLTVLETLTVWPYLIEINYKWALKWGQKLWKIPHLQGFQMLLMCLKHFQGLKYLLSVVKLSH